MGLAVQGRVLEMVEVLMLCLELAYKRAASFFLPASTQAGGPGEKAGPGLEEQWCFISQIINYNGSNPPPLLPSAYTVLPSFPTPWAEEAMGTG